MLALLSLSFTGVCLFLFCVFCLLTAETDERNNDERNEDE
nr:hypothetical protein [Escherichia coli]